jgi:hypothetical protein
MANFHLNSQPYLEQLSYNQSTDIVLEIGSDQSEGSTEFFNGLSVNHEILFYTVDVVDVGQHKFQHLDTITWQISQSGSFWAKTVLPTLNKKIKVLYLDNYDWCNPGAFADEIKNRYANRDVDWSNMGSQVEHVSQMINCLPYMAEQSLVICDDTPLVEHSGTYTGKCGAVVPLLLSYNYKIVYSGNNGVILARGI